ncbi:MAG: hypothetical protein ACP5IE_01850 [Infirmifilum sp.]
MKLSNIVVFVLMLGLVALLVFYIPLEVIKGVSARTLDPLFGGVVAALSILSGAALGFFSLVFTLVIPLEEAGDRGIELKMRETEKKILAYRARQRAMLEELDAIKKELEEIRDILKEGMGV